MEDSKFDVIIFGTGLTESIVAAALSKWGFRVAHIDRNPYYGDNEASLTLDEFSNWVDSRASNLAGPATRSATIPPFARQYSVCLRPTIIPSIGPFIDALVQSGVSKYSGFRLLESVAIYDGFSGFKSVPGSKEDVFRNKDVTLIQKRRLMRFLTFAAGDFEQSTELQGRHNIPFAEFLETVFSLNTELIIVIAYALAYSCTSAEPTMLVLPRIRRYLRSMGRYGPSPFLVAQYGGVGEISQGFCRAAAVNGAVYILGREIVSITSDLTNEPTTNSPPPERTDDQFAPTVARPKPHQFSVSLEDIPETLYASAILGSASYIPARLREIGQYLPISSQFKAAYVPTLVARCVAIIEHQIVFHLPIQEDAEDVDDEDDADNDKESQREKESPSADKTLDTAVLVFPPGSLEGGSSESPAVVLVNGEGTLSAPKGKYILYLWFPVTGEVRVDPAKVLRPYLDVILKLGREEAQEPIFTAFYAENLEDDSSSKREFPRANNPTPWLIPPPVPLGPLGDISDAATQNAELAFHEILKVLGDNNEKYQKGDTQDDGIWPKSSAPENEDDA